MSLALAPLRRSNTNKILTTTPCFVPSTITNNNNCRTKALPIMVYNNRCHRSIYRAKPFLITAVFALLFFNLPYAKAWQGPFSLEDVAPVVTDKPLIAVNDYTCHASGGFAFRVASESKFKRVGKLRIKFLDSEGNEVGSVAGAYRLQPKSNTLMSMYSPCSQAASFAVRHEPI